MIIYELIDLFKNYNLPDEIISKILFNFYSIKHPIAKLLFDEFNCNLKLISSRTKKGKLVNNYFVKNKMNNITIKNLKQIAYPYLPSTYIPNKIYKLYFNIDECNKNIITGINIKKFNLNRSFNILKKTKCLICNRYIRLNIILNRWLYIQNNFYNFRYYTELLKKMEKKYGINLKNYICDFCLYC